MKNLVGLGAKRLGFGFVRQRSVSAPGFFFAASGVEEHNFIRHRAPARSVCGFRLLSS